MCTLTDCDLHQRVDFFLRLGREVVQDESGAWWSEGHRLGRCAEDVRENESNTVEINNENGEAA